MTDNATMIISELAKAIIKLASEKNVILVLAESCTGGMIAAALPLSLIHISEPTRPY